MTTSDAASAPTPRRITLRLLGIAAALVGALLLVAFNLSVTLPVRAALSVDSRNSGITLVAYRFALVHPTEITLDLRGVSEESAPVDLFRGLMQAAGALKGRHYSKVTLAREGKAVFALDGDEFQRLGASYEAGENPVYLIRTLPEKLRRPDGTAPFGGWEGGWLGVLSRQMEDVTTFAASWASGVAPASAVTP